MDFASGGDYNQMIMLMDVNIQMIDSEEEIIVVGAKNEI